MRAPLAAPSRVAAGAALALALTAPPAAADCAPMVRVDGIVLWESGDAGRTGLAAGRPLPADLPECPGETGRGWGGSEDIVVRSLRGVPATTAVEYAGDLYVSGETLLAVRGHPLRRVVTPPRRRRCHGSELLRGKAAEVTGALGFAVDARGAQPRWLMVDGRTRITNRPSHQPLVNGQRLEVRATRCRPHWFADRVTFVGRTLQPERERDPPPWYAFLLFAGAAVAAGSFAWRRARRG